MNFKRVPFNKDAVVADLKQLTAFSRTLYGVRASIVHNMFFTAQNGGDNINWSEDEDIPEVSLDQVAKSFLEDGFTVEIHSNIDRVNSAIARKARVIPKLRSHVNIRWM